ncbi:queuosine precursor transporter [Polaribacter litorisediminis]|uniref:queuosine precursor transporter n=1 Tax=Polaribacter litorisediminis TaxID=1908341 RepID=UPI001CBAC141|nr:queuosine precursor transporter [Polaribacter litorisediminis]UAM97004.1 queuosine precursor transporter [Polaribacter litorisediminis]
MNQKDKLVANRIYLILAALFIASLVTSNLIFQKFFYWYPFEIEIFEVKLFEVSVGLLPYPLTFLITDILSEIYGKRKANEVVIAGIFASFFSLLIIYISKVVPATSWSQVQDDTFLNVFGAAPLAVFASMAAYLFAQFIDIRVYHFWKKLTKGKHLWLRNNFSTFSSQFIDTLTVLILLCSFEIINWDKFWGLLLSGVIFKILIALIDTPFLYIVVYAFRKRFRLKVQDEITDDILLNTKDDVAHIKL